ncbi:MAG: GHKL domain-containing protein [Butyrivibrio sp.]|nr:GHKL domain-containing protein [Butyrivibrio sp.]
MKDYIVAVIYCVLDIFKYYFCMTYVFNIKIIRKRYAIPGLVVLTSVACALSFLLSGGADSWYVVPNICTLMIVFVIPKGNRLKGLLFLFLSWVITDSVAELVRIVASAFGYSGDIFFGPLSWGYMNNKLVVIMLIFVYHGIVNIAIRKKFDYSFRSAQWGVIIVGALGVLFIVPTLEKISFGVEVTPEDYMKMSFTMILMLFLFIGVMIWQSYIVKKNLSMKEREIRYQYMVKSQAAYFDSLLKDYSEVRKFKHDMRAHVTALTELATDSKNDKMLEYLKSIDAKIASSATKSYTGNKAVDAVINELVKHMDEANIKFEYEGILRNREDILDFDFCTIFYNVLQNAIEASKPLEESMREVSVEVKNVGDKAGILISNKTELKELPTKSAERFTTKKDKENHGFGIQNIKDVVKKYDGIYEAKIADSRYTVTIVI